MKAPRLLCSIVVGAATAVVLSCGDSTPVAVHSRPQPPDRLLIGPLPLNLLQCSPLAYDSVSQTIGPAGGFVQVGPHVLLVPPGALADTVTITAVAPSETVNRVRFQPEGLTFERSTFLTMSYANCDLLGGLFAPRIAFTTPSLDILYYLASLNDSSAQSVTGLIKHFSDYAIAW